MELVVQLFQLDFMREEGLGQWDREGLLVVVVAQKNLWIVLYDFVRTPQRRYHCEFPA